jgi:hypothetical protein
VPTLPGCQEGDCRVSVIHRGRERTRGLASGLNLGDYLFLGKGRFPAAEKPLLADALEALLATVYLDGGLEAVIAVVERIFAEYLIRPCNIPGGSGQGLQDNCRN